MAPKLYAGAKLREVRQRLNLSQAEFAGRLKVSIPYLSQMENKHRFITYDVLSLS
jgi:transcriptional regulator with XRE-family HTH domain